MTEIEQLPIYRTDVINAAMGGQRLTNPQVAEQAGVTTKTVSAVRNGSRTVKLSSLKAVVEAIGLTMAQVFEEKAA